MAHWPLDPRPTRTLSTPRSASTSLVTQVTATASATSHVKGAWAELVATVDAPVRLIGLNVSDSFLSGSATNMMLDLGVGAAGAEVTIVENLLVGYAAAYTSQHGLTFLPLPLPVPAGERLAARIQALIASDTLKIHADLWGGGPWDGAAAGRAVTYGASTSTTLGVVVTSGAANTKGAWADITTSTTAPHSRLMLLTQPNARIVTATEAWLVDVGLWNGTSYDVIFADVPWRYESNEQWFFQGMPPISPLTFSLPAGSRLGVRAQCATASLTIDACLYGMR